MLIPNTTLPKLYDLPSISLEYSSQILYIPSFSLTSLQEYLTFFFFFSKKVLYWVRVLLFAKSKVNSNIWKQLYIIRWRQLMFFLTSNTLRNIKSVFWHQMSLHHPCFSSYPKNFRLIWHPIYFNNCDTFKNPLTTWRQS